MLRFQSELGASELDLVIRVTDTATIRMDTTDPIGTTAIPAAPHTTTGTATTVIIGIITTIATNLK
jgi:hypothetical protein